MIRALALVLVLPAPVARAECLLGCNTEVKGVEAAGLWQSLTGTLPEGVTVTHALQGGFQDPFWQLRAEADAAGLAALLTALPLGAFSPPDAFQTTITEAAWWTPTLPGAVAAPLALPGVAYSVLIRAPDPDRPGITLLFLLAFQT